MPEQPKTPQGPTKFTILNVLNRLMVQNRGIMGVVFEDVELAATTASFDFQNIPATYTHLKIVGSFRGDTAAAATQINVTFNNDTGNNYDAILSYVAHSGSLTTEEDVGQAAAGLVYVAAANAVANTFGSVEMTILDYTDTGNLKTARATGHHVSAQSTGNVFLNGAGMTWRSAAAINRITLTPAAGSFVSGSRATLYGVY